MAAESDRAAADKPVVLLTGIAGFIGFHFARRLRAEGHPVVGIDNLNDYYDVNLKLARLRELGFTAGESGDLATRAEARLTAPGLVFYKADLKDREKIAAIFAAEKPQLVVHLAAQAGVRYSLQNPWAYVDSNLAGFMTILENCRQHSVRHLVFASSSSVYGGNHSQPFSVGQNVDHPLSLYAASKKANELMAHSYAHLFAIPTTGLRFFTVYGPWGRPDMALFIFTRKILAGEPIEVYNHGDMKRDFTYVDDIVEGMWRVLNKPPRPDPDWDARCPDPASSSAPYRLFNIGNQRPVDLLRFIGLVEKNLGRKAEKVLLPLQPGDVPETCADIADLQRHVGFAPGTAVEDGVARFIRWYRDFHAGSSGDPAEVRP
ncbi:MAG: NAD-dependent epimerase [Acidobacteria bacterium]|jgi:UDP-glucuronate 4-epimerase|nr:NAD-dependent epimerase [Acidobacteriota bacterium]